MMCVGRSGPDHLVRVNTSSRLSTTIPDMYGSIFSSTMVKYFSGSESGKPWWKSRVEERSKLSALKGEYTSAEFDLYLTKEGIKHELTIPHTPQQNGVTGRLNRTLVEGVRIMLADSKLPHRFWAEALSTATYLHNRSPTNTLEGITPFEAWSGTKPDVSSLHIFGCSAYAHVPKSERRKLDSKTKKCVLLGYGANQKGYRLYDLECMKVINCRDVVFNQASMPGIQKKNETTVKYVELQIEEDSVFKETATPDPADTVREESTASNPIVSEPSLRRSARNRQQPDRYSYNLILVST